MDNQGKKKILIVDDDSALRKLYSVELTTRNFNVVEAQDGREGYSKATTEKPDLILLDVMMPQVDGITLLQQIRQNDSLKEIPVIMLTNFGQENLIQQAFDLGATDYLLKYKVTQQEMAEKIIQILTPKTS